MGNIRDELIVYNQDWENKDIRNPYYTWPLLDKAELMNWIITRTD